MDAQARRYLSDSEALSCPWVESLFFDHLLEARGLADADQRLVQKYHDDGYVVLDKVIEPELVDRIVAEYPSLFDPANPFESAGPELRELLQRAQTRKQDAWAIVDPIRELACHPRILSVLRLLYGREPVPFQTLNFLPGTEQGLHSDAIHFSSIPARFMCGVWVALEDATLENGPLRYVPGSHKLSELQLDDLGLWAQDLGGQLGPNYQRYEEFVQALVETRGLEVKQLVVEKGSALVWAANLLHGGSPITRKDTTRKSQVTHYYFEDCVYYTPIFSNTRIGEIFLRSITNIRTGERMEHRFNGAALRTEAVGAGRFRLADARESLSPLEADREAHRRALAQTRAELAAASEGLEDLRAELARERNDGQLARTALELDLAGHRVSLDEVKRLLAEHREQSQRLSAEIARADARANELAAELNDRWRCLARALRFRKSKPPGR